MNSVSSLSRLATSYLESWSLAEPHSLDEEELVLDCIDVLCLPSLVGGDEIVAMEKGVESWSTLLRFMNKMFTNGSSEAERCVFDFKVANVVSTLVQHADRSQLKKMFTHTFDVVSLLLQYLILFDSTCSAQLCWKSQRALIHC